MVYWLTALFICYKDIAATLLNLRIQGRSPVIFVACNQKWYFRGVALISIIWIGL